MGGSTGRLEQARELQANEADISAGGESEGQNLPPFGKAHRLIRDS